jgi:hypothetical protein
MFLAVRHITRLTTVVSRGIETPGDVIGLKSPSPDETDGTHSALEGFNTQVPPEKNSSPSLTDASSTAESTTPGLKVATIPQHLGEANVTGTPLGPTPTTPESPTAAPTPQALVVAPILQPTAPPATPEPIMPSAGEQAPNATPSGQITREQIISFISQDLQLSNERNIDALLACRGASVDYFDQGVVNQDYIRSDMSKYFQRWPVDSEQLVGPIQIMQGKSADEVVALFKTHFRVQNIKGNFIEGDNDNTLTIDIDDGVLKILGEKAHITNRRKGMVRPQVAVLSDEAPPQPIQQIPRVGPALSQSELDNSQNATSRVYKLPELKNLAGKRLQNAYLSGSFICLSFEGHYAVLQSYNDTPFIGPATTQQAETFFQQGNLYMGNTELEVTFSTVPELHHGMALHFSADSPLKIISVSTTLGNHFRVVARYDD